MPQKCSLKISRNISYKSRTLLSPTGSFLLQQPEERSVRNLLRNFFLLINIGSICKLFWWSKQTIFMDFISFVNFLLNPSETSMAAFADILKDQGRGIKQIRLLAFMLSNSMSCKTKVVQAGTKHYASHAIYINLLIMKRFSQPSSCNAHLDPLFICHSIYFFTSQY